MFSVANFPAVVRVSGSDGEQPTLTVVHDKNELDVFIQIATSPSSKAVSIGLFSCDGEYYLKTSWVPKPLEPEEPSCDESGVSHART